ncbi:MAG: C69 family dipeptidase [Deltaproteobacteria bacterium]|nr:C69 family dipeptidase [Deltaproteobacteria bacterium]
MCDTLVRVLEGRVLFAKNSDRDPNEAQVLDWQPRRAHPAGARLRCTWIEIPQARATHAVLLSRPFWMWGAEIGTNEHGVTIGNEAVFTRQPYAATGLTGMDLLRLGLERAATAAEAVEVITALLETHGQGGGCGHERRAFTYHNSFLVADPRGAFVLETAGRRWQAQRIYDAWSLSNGLTLPGIADESDRVKTAVSACRARRAITTPAAHAATDVGSMMRALRDHGTADHAPHYHWSNGALAAPCVHAGGLLTSSQTTASWVADLRPGAIQHWATATAAPCVSLFKPVAVAEPVDLGAPTDRADDSLWWRHERLHRRVLRDPARLRPLVVCERDRIEAGWLAAPPPSRAAFAEGDAALAAWTARARAAPAIDTRPAIARRYWRIRDRRAGL